MIFSQNQTVNYQKSLLFLAKPDSFIYQLSEIYDFFAESDSQLSEITVFLAKPDSFTYQLSEIHDFFAKSDSLQ